LDRIAWAVDRLGVQPAERILELGSGHGVAASLICAAGGIVLGLDRSAKMTTAATERNAEHVEARRARFITTAVEEADLGAERFDKVLAIRFPPLLRGDASGVLAAVRERLKQSGALYVAEQPLGSGAATAEAIVARLRAGGFEPVAEIVDDQGERPNVCVVGRPVSAELPPAALPAR
jgi:protein-L-isoaspartate O-methyltransferase